MPNIRPLSEELQLTAINELNEVPERLAEDIAALRSWIEEQQHLTARTDDQFLVTFLRGCKFNMDKAKDKIDKYYTFRTIHESSLTWRNVEDPRIQEILQLGVTTILPKPLGGDNGPRIAIIRVGSYPADKFTLSEIVRASTPLQEISMLEDDNTIICGYVQIMDFIGFTASHFLQLNPLFMRRFSIFTEEALPMRLRSVHFINTPVGFETVFNTIKSFMPTKVQQRVKIHGKKMNELYKTVPKEYLPKEYGGENGSLKEIANSWTKKVLAHREWFIDDMQYKTDEALRKTKGKNDSTLGSSGSGSFRKLFVD